MFSTTTSCLPHMMAHASSADVPHNSEVSTADLDSEAFVTIPSATPSSPSLFSTTTENMQLDMLTHLLEAHNNSAATTDRNCATDDPSAILLSDPSVIAMASPSSVWTTSPSISPMLLKLESPVLTNPDSTQRSARIKTKSKSKSKTTATTSSSTLTAVNTSGRKRAAVDPIEKEAKVRERVLRNRAAAQESRDKKRKYVADIEASNESLQQENAQLLKRLKTVESNNLELSQRLEALTAQFAQMQQLLSQSIKHNNPSGVGFCQSAVLAKEDKKSHSRGTLTNSLQQKLAPQKNLHSTISKVGQPNKHGKVYSMTMMNSMSKERFLNREARWLNQSATQNRMEISCRPFCNNRRNRTLTLSSSAVASFQVTRQSTRQVQATKIPVALVTLLFLTSILPQLMLNFSTLFLISTGTRSSNPQELQLQQAVHSFLRRLFWGRRLSKAGSVHSFQPGTIKDTITSLNPSVIEEIVTEFRQGRKEVARGLLVKALLSSRRILGKDERETKGKLILLLRRK